MTASQHIRTPLMQIPLLPGKARQDADTVCKYLQRVTLPEVIDEIVVIEQARRDPISKAYTTRTYNVRLYYAEDAVLDSFGVTKEELQKIFDTLFVSQLTYVFKLEKNQRKRAGKMGIVVGSKKVTGNGDEDEEGQGGRRGKGDSDDEVDDEELGAEANKRRSRTDKNKYDDDADNLSTEDNELADDLPTNGADEDETTTSKNAKAVPKKPSVAPSSDTDDDNEDDDDEDDEMGDGVSKGKPVKKESENEPTMHVESELSHLGSRYFSTAITVPASYHKVLMIDLVKRATEKVLVRSTKGISKCHVREDSRDKSKIYIETEGVNFSVMGSLTDTVDVNSITSNDIAQILKTYGVEAAHTAITREIFKVFDVYGIAVDHRHITLLADYMTFEGGYTPLNRIGIGGCISPFQKISFETSMSFLMKAALYGEYESNKSPSSRIVFGQAVRCGTGAMSVLHPIHLPTEEES